MSFLCVVPGFGLKKVKLGIDGTPVDDDKPAEVDSGCSPSKENPPKPDFGSVLLSAGKKDENDDLHSLSADSSKCPMLKL
jgi:hypothetical protein